MILCSMAAFYLVSQYVLGSETENVCDLCENLSRHEHLSLLVDEKWKVTTWPVSTQLGIRAGRARTYSSDTCLR